LLFSYFILIKSTDTSSTRCDSQQLVKVTNMRSKTTKKSLLFSRSITYWFLSN